MRGLVHGQRHRSPYFTRLTGPDQYTGGDFTHTPNGPDSMFLVLTTSPPKGFLIPLYWSLVCFWIYSDLSGDDLVNGVKAVFELNKNILHRRGFKHLRDPHCRPWARRSYQSRTICGRKKRGGEVQGARKNGSQVLNQLEPPETD